MFNIQYSETKCSVLFSQARDRRSVNRGQAAPRVWDADFALVSGAAHVRLGGVPPASVVNRVAIPTNQRDGASHTIILQRTRLPLHRYAHVPHWDPPRIRTRGIADNEEDQGPQDNRYARGRRLPLADWRPKARRLPLLRRAESTGPALLRPSLGTFDSDPVACDDLTPGKRAAAARCLIVSASHRAPDFGLSNARLPTLCLAGAAAAEPQNACRLLPLPY